MNKTRVFVIFGCCQRGGEVVRMYKATVSGSFRRHLREVQEAIDELTRHDVRVLSPRSPVSRIWVVEGFTALALDPYSDIKKIQDHHMECISRSDFHFVVCPDGVIGESTAMEIGWATEDEVPIFSLSPLHDDMDGLSNPVKAVEVVRNIPEMLEKVEKRRDWFRKALTLLKGFRNNR